jgi:predicted ATPase
VAKAEVETLEHAEQLIGREAELARLGSFLDSGGHPRALLLSGDPGVGKTTLWEAGIEAAQRRSLRVLSARPSGAEAQLSFAALTDLLENVDVAALPGLPAPQRQALEVALLRAEPVGPSLDPRAIATGLLNALRELAAAEPLVVAVDDVQWLDRPSADALAFAARRLEDSDIRFLVAKRSGSSSALEPELSPTELERLEISPLSLGATRRMLFERLHLSLPRRVLRQVFESSGGNPLFALELGRTLAARGALEIGEEMPVPDVIEDLIGVRVAQLSRPVR